MAALRAKSDGETPEQYMDAVRDTLYNPELRMEEENQLPLIGELTEKSFMSTDAKHVDTVYVCGLAGDWCVLDTCINLKLKNPKLKVMFLLDYTRFVVLPKVLFGTGPTDIPEAAYPSKVLVDDHAKYGLALESYWVNHPFNTFSLLQKHGISVVYNHDAMQDQPEQHRSLHRAYYKQYEKHLEAIDSKMLLDRIDMKLKDIQAELNKDNTALFVIDMQNDFCLPSADIGVMTPLSIPILADGMLKDIAYNEKAVVSTESGWGYARKAPPVQNGSVPVGPTR